MKRSDKAALAVGAVGTWIYIGGVDSDLWGRAALGAGMFLLALVAKKIGDYVEECREEQEERDSILYMMNVVEKDESVDLVIGSFRSMPESNLYYGEHAISGKQNLKQMSLDFLFNIRSFYYGVVWNKLYKRQMIQQNNIKFNREIPWCEDFFFNLQYYKCCEWLYFLPVNKLVYDYIQHASSTTKTIHRLPKGQGKKINELRTQATKEFFEEMGLSDILRLEWKYSFIFSNLFDLAKGKKKSIKEKYRKVKDTFEQEGVSDSVLIVWL